MLVLRHAGLLLHTDESFLSNRIDVLHAIYVYRNLLCLIVKSVG